MRSRRLLASTVVLSATMLAVTACGDDDADVVEEGVVDEEVVDEEVVDEGAGDAATDAAAAGDFAEGTTMAELSEAGSMRVGTKFDQPGFGLANLEGTPEGFDVEIAKIVATELGIDEGSIEWIETPSAIREEVLINDEVDLVAATYTINDERDERIDFAGPYYVAGQALMVRADEDRVSGPEDLSNTELRVCSVDGSTPSETIREYLGSPDQLVLFDVYSACADSLRNNQVDVVTTDNVILLGLVEESDGAFTLVGDTFTDEPYGIGVQEGDVEFCQFINDTLQAANEDGRYAEAWESTAGSIAGAGDVQFPELTPCE